MAVTQQPDFVNYASAFPLQYCRSTELVGKEGMKGFFKSVNWANQPAGGFLIKGHLRQFDLDVLASVWIDNSQCASFINLVFAGTFQNIQIPGNSIGAVSVLAFPTELSCTISSAAVTTTTSFIFTDKELLPIVWKAI